MRIAIVFAILLLLSAVAAANAHGERVPDVRPAPGERTHQQAGQDWQALSQEAREQGLQRAEQAELFARLSYQNGEAFGNFVSFRVDETTGSIHNHTVRNDGAGVVFLAAVEPTAFVPTAEPQVTGATLRVTSAAATLSVHNNPVAILSYTAGVNGLDLAVTLPANVVAEQATEKRIDLTAQGEAARLVLVGNGTLELDGTNVTVRLESQGMLLFLASPEEGPLAAVPELAAAITEGRMGGVLSLVRADDQAVSDRADFGVNMRPALPETGRVEIILSSEDARGRAVVVLLDIEAIEGASTADDMRILLDGEELPRAASAFAALTDSQAARASAHVQLVDGILAVTVSVPHFSERTLSIESTEESPETRPGDDPAAPTPQTENETPGLGIVGLLAAVGLVVVAMRRR